MITETVAEKYLADKELYDRGDLILSPADVQLRREALIEFGSEQERSQQRQRQMWMQKREDRVRSNFRDLETRGGNHTPDVREQFSWAIDQDDIRARLSIAELLAMEHDTTPDGIGADFVMLRDEYARKYHGGKVAKSNVEFWQREKERIEKEETLASGFLTLQQQAMAEGVADALRGGAPNWGAGFGKWQGQDALSTEIGRTAPQEKLREEYIRRYQEAFSSVEGFRDVADALAIGLGREDLDAAEGSELRGQKLEAIADRFIEAPREQQEAFLRSMAVYLQATFPDADPEERLKTFLRQAGERFVFGASSLAGEKADMRLRHSWDNAKLEALQRGQDVRLSRNADEGALTPNDLVTEADVARQNAVARTSFYSHSLDDYGRSITAEERNAMIEELQRRDQRYRQYLQLENVRQEMRPLQMVSPFPSAEGGLYALAESAPHMGAAVAASFLPGGSLLAFGVSAHAIGGQEYDQLLLQHPEISTRDAQKVATVSGLAQAGIELLGVKGLKSGGSLLLAKSPALSRVLSEAARPTSRFYAPFLARTAVGTGEQFGEEVAQGLVSAAVKNAILTDYPAASLKEAFFENASPETFFASLFMVLPASGAGSWSESRRVRQGLQSLDDLRGLGLTAEQAQPIMVLAQGGDFQQAEKLLQETYKGLPDQAVIEGLHFNQQRLEQTEALQQDSELPTLRQEGERYEIVEPDGSVSAVFDDVDVAERQLRDRLAWEQVGRGREVRELVQWFGERVDPERTVEITGRTKTVEEGMAESALNAETLAERMRIAAIEEGADPASLIIKGETVEQLREGVYRDVIRLYNGADVMDVVEEHAHAQLNLDLREGRLSHEEAARAAAQWAEETGFALEDASNPTDVEIQEALVDMAKAHFLNERKSLPELPNSVRAFIAKMRVYLREILGRAKAMIEMRETGKLSESVEGYLARTLGMNEQLELNRATVEAVGETTESSSMVEVGSSSFSIGVLDDGQKMPWKEPGEAQKWALANLRGEYPNEATGGDFVVDRNTITHTFNHSKMSGEKVRVLEAISDIILSARPMKPEKAYTRGTRRGVEMDQIFYAPVMVDEKLRIARIVVHRMNKQHGGGRNVYDVKSVEMEEAQLHQGSHPLVREEGLPVMPRFFQTIGDFGEIVKKAYPRDFEGSASYSIGRADYLSELAAAMDARRGNEVGLAFAEKVQANLERGSRNHELLERMVRLEQQQDARIIRLEEDIANLELRMEEAIEELRSQKAEQITKASTESMAKFMDRIEAAKTERERTLLRREARETAADLKRGIEKDFKAQEKALRERMRGEEKVLREKTLGAEKAEKAKADAADQRAAVIQALVDYNAIMMALPPEVRGKLGGFVALAKLKTDRARAKFFRERFPKVQAAFEKYLQTEYDAAIKKLFARAKPKRDKAGKKPVGKLGADMHSLFATLEEAMHWTAAEVAEHIAKLEGRLAEGELSPEAEARTQMEIGLVNLVGDWRNAEASRRGAAVANVKEVLRKGYGDYLIQKMEERAVRKETRLRLIADTGKSGSGPERDERIEKDIGLFGSLRSMKFELSSFEQLMGYCFGPKSADAQRLIDRQRLADNSRVDAEYMVSDGVNALFAELGGSVYKGAELHWRLSQKSMEVQGRSLSELEAISATLMWRQEDGRRHMEGIRDEEGVVTSSWSYGQEFIDEIEAKLSPEAVAVRDYLAGEYAAEYDLINPLFRKMNGVDLPKNANYSPLTVKPIQAGVGEVVDPVTGVAVNAASATPGSFRTRGRLTAEPDFRDAVKVYMAHKSQMNHWQAYAEFALEARSVLGNREVMNAVEARAGKAAVDALSGWLDYLIQGGNRDAAMRLEVNGMLSRMLSRAASMAIVGRVGVLAVQSTQLGAALAEMPTASYLKRMGQLFTGQLGWGEAIASPYIQRRMIEMPPLVRQAMEGLRAEKPSRVKHVVQMLGRTIAGADALFTAGTYAMVYDFKLAKLKEQGMSEAAAVKLATMEAERVTDRLAQPVRPGARSLYEVRTTGNPATRLLWAFASEARKNVGLAMYAMSNRTMAEKARTLAYVAVINPLVASLIRAAWRDARDAEDEDIFDEKHWNAKRMALAVATEPLAGIPVVGEMTQELIYKGLGVYVPSGNLLSSGANAVPAIKRLPETLAGDHDAAQVLRDAESILTGMGLFNANLAAAASLSHIARDLFGAAENAKEQIEE